VNLNLTGKIAQAILARVALRASGNSKPPPLLHTERDTPMLRRPFWRSSKPPKRRWRRVRVQRVDWLIGRSPSLISYRAYQGGFDPFVFPCNSRNPRGRIGYGTGASQRFQCFAKCRE
jgi:hypothetical protein